MWIITSKSPRNMLSIPEKELNGQQKSLSTNCFKKGWYILLHVLANNSFLQKFLRIFLGYRFKRN